MNVDIYKICGVSPKVWKSHILPINTFTWTILIEPDTKDEHGVDKRLRPVDKPSIEKHVEKYTIRLEEHLVVGKGFTSFYIWLYVCNKNMTIYYWVSNRKAKTIVAK